MINFDIAVQQILIGLSNGLIISLIALGYSIVYGVLKIINFAHGDLFMLGSFLALTILGLEEVQALSTSAQFLMTLVIVPSFCGLLNAAVNAVAYRPLRGGPKLAPLVAAVGVSFIFMNLGLFWGSLPLEVFNFGRSPAAPKDFPELLSNENLFGDHYLQFTSKDLMVYIVTLSLLILLVILIKRTKVGIAMRAVAEDPLAARLMGIDVEKIVQFAFVLGGSLAGVASIVYAIYNNTVFFQMGFRVGLDAFSAAVLGGIGNLTGAVIGGILIGLIRAASDQYIATEWTGVVVFSVLVVVLIFKPGGIMGVNFTEKV